MGVVVAESVLRAETEEGEVSLLSNPEKPADIGPHMSVGQKLLHQRWDSGKGKHSISPKAQLFRLSP